MSWELGLVDVNMRFFAVVLLLVLSSVSGKHIDPSKGTSQCPLNDEELTATPSNVLGSLLYECVEISDGVKQQLDDANTTAQYKVVFRDLCRRIPETRQCMAKVTSKAHACLNGSDMTLFQLNLELMESAIGMVCFENGVRIATMLGNADECLSSREHDRAEVCINGTLAREFGADDDVDDDVDDTDLSLQPYKAMVSVRRCLVRNSEGCRKSVVEEAEAFIDEFLEKMNCVAHEGGHIVPCTQLVQDSSS